MKKKAPSAVQKRMHDEMAKLGCGICGGPARIHHCVGASAKHNKVSIGQWFCIPLCDHHHQHGPDAVHVSPTKFAELVGLDSRKAAEKRIFSQTLDAIGWRDIPEEVLKAIDDYHR